MQCSNNIEGVLKKEIKNKNKVFLYLEDNKWCAYERSAFYLKSLNVPINLEKKIISNGYDIILMKASFDIEKIHLPLSPSTVLKLVSDNNLIFEIQKQIKGFFEWKRRELN